MFAWASSSSIRTPRCVGFTETFVVSPSSAIRRSTVS